MCKYKEVNEYNEGNKVYPSVTYLAQKTINYKREQSD